MSDDDQHKAITDALAGLDQWSMYLDVLDGFVAATVARGYPEDMARALVVATMMQQGQTQNRR